MKQAVWMSVLLVLSLAPPAVPKRAGGGGFSIGRSGGSAGRGNSGARTSSGGGLFGGNRPTSTGNHGQKQTGGGWGGGHNSHNTGWGNSGGNRNTGGGIGHGSSAGNWNPKHSSSGWGRGHTSTYSKGNGIGSVFRSNTFKNAIVGAAAGYLTYQAGRAIIRSVTHPMMWGGRSYYWGSNYYQPRHGHTNMCRMPLEQNDEQFKNIFFQDNTRPREIVWGCGYYEYCCGYECCRGGSSPAYGLPVGVGGLFFAVFVLCCFLPMALRYYNMARMMRV